MKKLLIFRHESWIGAPQLTELLTEIGIPFQLIKIDQNNDIPETISEDVAGLVFLGGTMSVNDALPWIEKELNLIQNAHKDKLPVMGHCLGAQLMSKALGGTVTQMVNNEIGWHPIKFADNQLALEWKDFLPNDVPLLIWHHDEFTIPEGATSLYTTENCKNQAFVIDNMLATIAHIEVSESMLKEWLDIFGYDIKPNQNSVQSIAEIQLNLKDKIHEMQALSDSFYLKWLSLAYPDLNELKYYLRKGSCLCHAVKFNIKQPREVINCHCSECRKFHGNYAAYTKVCTDNLYIVGENNLAWYQATSEQAKRGWCKVCGSSLFWQETDSDSICIAAGALETPTNLHTGKNIYVKDASDYYVIDNTLDCCSGTMKS